MDKAEWFEEWFDTPFYHILYQNRDEEEAATFVDNLIQTVQLKKGARVLDLACGKGRHAVQLNKMGFSVVGADLSVNSIAQAKKHENDSLHFVVQDMREVIEGEKQFDAIFNLFTSFGYFEDKEDNVKVLAACHQMLKKKGLLVIDFLNIETTLQNLVEYETKTVEKITFDISRKFDGKHIVKAITFRHLGRSHSYTEKVQAFRKEDFQQLLENAGFKVKSFHGDNNFNDFNEESSPRLIVIAEKV